MPGIRLYGLQSGLWQAGLAELAAGRAYGASRVIRKALQAVRSGDYLYSERTAPWFRES
jgi:hypothetical protein